MPRTSRFERESSYTADSVGTQGEGDTLVVDVNTFLETAGLGEEGYFHTGRDARNRALWRDGEKLWVGQARSDDPKSTRRALDDEPSRRKTVNRPRKNHHRASRTTGTGY